MTRESLLGLRFDRLMVVAPGHPLVRASGQTFRRWVCLCDCGNSVVRTTAELKDTQYKTKSCGCAHRAALAIRNKTHGLTPRGNWAAGYSCWQSMRQRCLNPNSKSYESYGGRGITVCAQWGQFAQFLADMGPRPSAAHSIERRDNNGNYEPSNCYWADAVTQNRNKGSVRLTFEIAEQARERFRGGERICEIARAFGQNANLIGLAVNNKTWLPQQGAQ